MAPGPRRAFTQRFLRVEKWEWGVDAAEHRHQPGGVAESYLRWIYVQFPARSPNQPEKSRNYPDLGTKGLFSSCFCLNK